MDMIIFFLFYFLDLSSPSPPLALFDVGLIMWWVLIVLVLVLPGMLIALFGDKLKDFFAAANQIAGEYNQQYIYDDDDDDKGDQQEKKNG